MKRLLLAATVLALASVPGLANDQALLKDAQTYFKPIPSIVPAVKDNAVTRDKVDLGKMLFFDPRVSGSHLISCNTCHNLSMGGDDNLETSIGHGWAKGPRNAPTVLNAVFNKAQFWDGRAADLKAQAKGPIQAGVEMNNTPKVVEETLLSIPTYVAKFKTAFPNEAQPVTFDNLARAIEAFEATLITPSSWKAMSPRSPRSKRTDCACSWTRGASPATRASISAARSTTRSAWWKSPAP